MDQSQQSIESCTLSDITFTLWDCTRCWGCRKVFHSHVSFFLLCFLTLSPLCIVHYVHDCSCTYKAVVRDLNKQWWWVTPRHTHTHTHTHPRCEVWGYCVPTPPPWRQELEAEGDSYLTPHTSYILPACTLHMLGSTSTFSKIPPSPLPSLSLS